MDYRASRTLPLPYIQRHFIYNMPTTSAPFRTRKPSINFYQFTSVPLAFVSKLTYQFSPRSIRNMQRQFVVFNHVFNRQILNHDGLVFVHQLSSQLMQKVFSAISYLGVYFSYFEPRFVSIIRPFLLARQRFLYSSEFSPQPFKVPWLAILSPLLVAIKLEIPTSKPIDLLDFGNGSTNVSTSKET